MPDHPDTLVKYCTAETAFKSLSAQRLRWHAPNLFDDPFELDYHTRLSFDPHTLLRGVIRAATAMIFSPDTPRGTSPLSTVVRRWREEKRFDSHEEAEDVLEELMGRMTDQQQKTIDQIMADWRNFTRHLRICCFSAKPGNLPCWQQYADNHRGVAIRLRCGPNTALPEPRAVAYQKLRPEITTFKQQLNAVLHNEHYDAQSEFLDKFLVKPPPASTEREWRCFGHTDPDESGEEDEDDEKLWYQDRPFAPEELTTVYLGAHFPEAERATFKELLREHYPDTRLLQARPVPGRFEIEFERLSKR